jgi:hypothetical protein
MGKTGAPTMPAAREREWETVFRRGTELRLKGKYSDALAVIQQTVGIARAGKDPRNISISLNMLGLLLWIEGKLAELSELSRKRSRSSRPTLALLTHCS